MATTYKVLGQTSATAAAATDNLNLVRDPSFEGLTLTTEKGTFTTNTTNIQTLSTIGVPRWHVRSDTASSLSFVNNSGFYSVTANKGSKALGVNFDGGNAGYSYWFIYGQGSSSVGITNMDTIDTTRAIPVSPSTTYYFGASYYCSSASIFGTADVQVHWFNSSGSVISSNSVSIAKASGAFVRGTSSATSPSTAAYAQIRLYSYPSTSANGHAFYWDAVHFSPVSSTNTTWPDPSTGSDLTLTAPFTSRLSTGWTGTANDSTTGNTYAGTPVDLYTVPAATQTVVSTISVSNISTSATTYRIAVVPSGETLAKKHWIIFDTPIAANSTDTLTLGVTLNAGDKIKVASDIANVSFSAFGSEIA